MATITPVPTDSAGEAVTYAAASGGGDTIATGGTATRVRVKNGSGSPITVTLTGVVACSQGSTHNVTYTVTAGQEQEFKVPAQCVNPSNGNVAIGYSSATSVTVAATQ